MGCLKLYETKYKGEIIKMPNTSQNQTTNTNSTSNNDNQEFYVVPKVAIRILVGLSSIVAAIIGWMALQLYDLNADSAVNTQAITEIQTNLEKINTGLDGIPGTKGVYTRLEVIETTIKNLNIPILSASEDLSESIDEISVSRNDFDISLSPLLEHTKVGTDAAGRVYLAEELINQPIFLTYLEKGTEVYFLGQYNENYHWDGYCITNAYNSNGILSGICESNFNDGVRLDYKSFVVSEKTPNEWTLSERVCDNSEDGKTKKNVGISKTYILDYDEVKNFTKTNARITDVLSIDKFLPTINIQLYKYYHGDTFNGLYNDTTGNAYYVEYDTNGYITSLYVGNFVDGMFCDNTGNAWNIIYSEKYNAYMCNRGNFNNNHAVEYSDKILTLEEVKEIISDYKFDCELKWKNN